MNLKLKQFLFGSMDEEHPVSCKIVLALLVEETVLSVSPNVRDGEEGTLSHVPSRPSRRSPPASALARARRRRAAGGRACRRGGGRRCFVSVRFGLFLESELCPGEMLGRSARRLFFRGVRGALGRSPQASACAGDCPHRRRSLWVAELISGL